MVEGKLPSKPSGGSILNAGILSSPTTRLSEDKSMGTSVEFSFNEVAGLAKTGLVIPLHSEKEIKLK